MIIDMDIEAMNMNYVQQWYDKVIGGGIKYGEIKSMYYTAGRQAGKSTLNQYYGKLYETNLCKEILIPMKTEPKYKFSRAKWHEAPRPGVASWNTFSGEYHEILNWCEVNFGKHPKRPDAWSRWYMGVETVNFRDERDYVLYQLRWA